MSKVARVTSDQTLQVAGELIEPNDIIYGLSLGYNGYIFYNQGTYSGTGLIWINSGKGLGLTLAAGYTAGSWTSPVIDISQVVKVNTSSISLNWSGSYSNVIAYTRLSTNNGASWGNWTQYTGGVIYGLEANVNVRNYRLQFRLDLSTTNASYAPVIQGFFVNVLHTTYDLPIEGFQPNGNIITVNGLNEPSDFTIVDTFDPSTSLSLAAASICGEGFKRTVQLGFGAFSTFVESFEGSSSFNSASLGSWVYDGEFAASGSYSYRYDFLQSDAAALTREVEVGPGGGTISVNFYPHRAMNGYWFQLLVDNSVKASYTGWGSRVVPGNGNPCSFPTTEYEGDAWHTLSASIPAGRHKVTLACGMPNHTFSPVYIFIDHVSITNYGTTYAANGLYTSPVYDLSNVGSYAATATLIPDHTAPTGTSVNYQTNVSLNGGSTWLGWKNISNGSIQDIIGNRLNNAQLQIRAQLASSTLTTTPIVRPYVVNITADNTKGGSILFADGKLGLHLEERVTLS